MVFGQWQDAEPRTPLWARYSLEVLGASEEESPTGETGRSLRLTTSRGDVRCLLHQPSGTMTGLGVVWAPGARGGFAGPANGLYRALAEELTGHGVTSLRVDYRHAGHLDESTLDVLAAIWRLEDVGCPAITLVGHSFGGGVVVSAARYASSVRAVAVLASQTHGAEDVALLGGRRLLVVHGEADDVLPVSNARLIHDWAPGPAKQLVTYPGAGHGLRECADELRALLRDWLLAGVPGKDGL